MIEAQVAYFNIKIDGSQVPIEFMNDMLECIVENSLQLPDACSIRFSDIHFVWVDSDQIKEGKKVEVFSGEDKEQLQPIFVGEIVSADFDMAAQGFPTVTIRSLSYSHRLSRGRHRRSFCNMKDSDIVSQISSEAALTASVDDSGEVRDYIFQNNLTNWEFIQALAARNGFRVFVKGERDLQFKKLDPSGDGTIQLTWGEDLRSFRPRVSASPQVDEVMVRGWDMKQKQAIVGTANSAQGTPSIGGSSNGGSVASQAFGVAKLAVVDRPVVSAGSATDLAQSIIDEIGGSYLEAEGLCYANKDLIPGKVVQINNIGQRFSGTYYVTSTTHSYSPAEGYTTQFVVSGKRANTIQSILDKGEIGQRRQLGSQIVVGIVTNNKDPDNLGRIKVKFPWLTDEDESFWARLSAPMAGPQRGFYFIPEVNDEVLVAFEHGDICYPYILGALWNGLDNPIEGNSTAVDGDGVEHRIIKTRIGHTLLFDDTGGTGEVKITTCNGHIFTLNDKDKCIKATTTGGHKIFMDDQQPQIQIVDSTGSNSITIDSSQNSITMQCIGNMTLQCQGDFSLNATGQASIQGQAGITVQSPAIVEITGSMVEINS